LPPSECVDKAAKEYYAGCHDICYGVPKIIRRSLASAIRTTFCLM